MKWLSSILDIVFPPRCEVCRAVEPEALCGKCRASVTLLPPTAFIHSVGLYEGALKEAIHRFKFKKRTRLAEPLGAMLVRYISRNLDISAIDLLVPVPLHRNRLNERGFNQTELLSQVITRFYDVPTVSTILYRARETKPQFDLDGRERLTNVKGAFEVRGDSLISGRNLLLIDDIYTTGSTISECTRMLKSHGARTVHVLTLSRALHI